MRNSPMANVDKPPQFSLSQAAVVVAAIAIVLAIAAPWMRSFNPAQWMALLRFNLCILGGVIVYQVVVGHQFRKAARRAGRLLVVVNRMQTNRASFWAKTYCSVMFAFIICQALYHIHLLKDGLPPASPVLTSIEYLAPLGMTYQLLFMMATQTAIKFHENGLLMGWKMAEWNNFKTCRWGVALPNQLMVNCGTGMLLAIPIEADKREQVDAILRDKIPSLVYN